MPAPRRSMGKVAARAPPATPNYRGRRSLTQLLDKQIGRQLSALKSEACSMLQVLAQRVARLPPDCDV